MVILSLTSVVLIPWFPCPLGTACLPPDKGCEPAQRQTEAAFSMEKVASEVRTTPLLGHWQPWEWLEHCGVPLQALWEDGGSELPA